MIDRISTQRFVAVLVFALGLAIVGVAPLARAADSSSNARAARLTYLQGTVTVDRTGNTASQPAQLNLPLLAGVRLATGEDGQAEIEFEDGSLVRLTPNSALSLDNLSVEAGGDGGVFTTGLNLMHGLAYLELRATPQYRYTLNAGGDVLSPVENATVRVNFDEPPAVFAVLDGAARVERHSGVDGAGYQREVRGGESLRGDAADPTAYSLTPEIAADTWDAWNEDRDQAAASEAGSRTAVRDNFAGAQGYGWSDLDANGSWYDVPGQGQVWQPAAAATDSGFDPYGNGAWVDSGAGYLWASGYAWGWTPYRCGSWSFFNGFGWGWSPVVGCGGFGWGFRGVGRPVNIRFAPSGYRVPRVPEAGAEHPVLPGPQRQVAAQAGAFKPGPRRIGGVTVLPVEPVGSGYAARAGSSVGSALQRDYPVDGATHAAVLGKVSTQPGLVRSDSGWRSTGVRPAAASPAASRPVPVYRSPSAPVVRSAPAPEQRSSPPPAPLSAPRAAPAPAPAAAPARPR